MTPNAPARCGSIHKIRLIKLNHYCTVFLLARHTEPYFLAPNLRYAMQRTDSFHKALQNQIFKIIGALYEPRNYIADCFNLDGDRHLTNMVAQQKLGLRPERRAGPDRPDFDCLGSDGQAMTWLWTTP